MAFSNEDKLELTRIVIEAMDGERDRRRLALQRDREQNPPVPVIQLYLVTMPYGARIAFPDERCCAVMHETFYARVEKKDTFYGGSCTVVAYGDGKLLEKPHTVVLSGSVALVEVGEGILTAWPCA